MANEEEQVSREAQEQKRIQDANHLLLDVAHSALMFASETLKQGQFLSGSMVEALTCLQRQTVDIAESCLLEEDRDVSVRIQEEFNQFLETISGGQEQEKELSPQEEEEIELANRTGPVTINISFNYGRTKR